MCDVPEHTHLDRIEAMLSKMDEKVDDLAEGQEAIKVAVFGTGTTKGLVTKVDEINAGHRKESVMVSTITAIVVAGLSALGINLGTNP